MQTDGFPLHSISQSQLDTRIFFTCKPKIIQWHMKPCGIDKVIPVVQGAKQRIW